MAIPVPPIGSVTTLWQNRSVAAVQQYKDSIQQSGSRWQTAVDSSEDDWQNGVNVAASNGAYGRGVQGKASLYVDRAVSLGGNRYPTGIQAATTSYTAKMGKVLGIIANVTLPPRGPVGSNLSRVSAVTDLLHQAKISGQI